MKPYYKTHDIWICWRCGEIKAIKKPYELSGKLICNCPDYPNEVVIMDRWQGPDTPNQVTVIKNGRAGK